MSNRTAYLALAFAMAAAGAFALLRQSPGGSGASAEPTTTSMRSPTRPVEPRSEATPEAQTQPPGSPLGSPQALPPGSPQALPPGHPQIGSSGGSPAGRIAPPTEDPNDPGVLTWTVPPTWASAPNPSTMRLATYRVSHVANDADDAELSISRAGGNVDANLQRWVGQFEDPGKDTRTTRTVRGLKVTTVEVSGSFMAGGMMGPATKKTGWSLLGAIVETPAAASGASGSSYFFKMVGPTATVQSARAGFTKMLDSLTPK